MVANSNCKEFELSSSISSAALQEELQVEANVMTFQKRLCHNKKLNMTLRWQYAFKRKIYIAEFAFIEPNYGEFDNVSVLELVPPSS